MIGLKTNSLPWYERFAENCRKKGTNLVITDRQSKDKYLERFYLFPRWASLGLFRVVIHRFNRSDDDFALHSHPWLFWGSKLLRGNYYEFTEKGVQYYTPRSPIRFNTGWKRHRLELEKDENHNEKEVWTIFIMGPKIRIWGFYDEDEGKEIPYDIYLKTRRAKV